MAHKGKILVVDDDRLVLATLAHGLSQAGYDVIDTDNGDDAILMAREHRPDLALLDIRMEGMSGFDVAAYLRDYCQMPFMFLSAFSDDATVNQVKELGAVAYLVKPLDIRQIVPAVEAAFANIHGRADELGAAHRRVERSPASNEATHAHPGHGRGGADAPLFTLACGRLAAAAALGRGRGPHASVTRPNACSRRSNCCRSRPRAEGPAGSGPH